MSAGRYICGEESALLSALEGRRAVPRHKPPFPAASGLFGQPTTVNNVETICNVPHIVKNGAEWYKSLGFHKDGGTKLFGASGHVNRPGLAEMPLGTRMGDLLEHFGGIREGLQRRDGEPSSAEPAGVRLGDLHILVPSRGE